MWERCAARLHHHACVPVVTVPLRGWRSTRCKRQKECFTSVSDPTITEMRLRWNVRNVCQAFCKNHVLGQKRVIMNVQLPHVHHVFFFGGALRSQSVSISRCVRMELEHRGEWSSVEPFWPFCLLLLPQKGRHKCHWTMGGATTTSEGS